MTLPQVGDFFADRFQLHAKLGEGGFAVVYRAHDVIDQRDVALKLILPDEEGYSTQRMARFDREVQALRRLRSPHTVRLFHHGLAQGVLFLAFELVPGVDLSELAGARVPPDVVRHILLQLLDSLGEAHAHNVLHRDIKPANIRVFQSGDDPYCVKLLDFGIARPLHTGGPKVTKTGHVVGTLRFASPEQLFGEQLTPASDLYSLALVVYLLLTGEVPDHMRAHTAQQPVCLPDGVADGNLKAVVDRLLSMEARDRFQSAEQVVHALTGTLPTHPAPQPAPRSSPPPVGPSMQQDTRRANVVMIGAVVMTAVIAGVVVWALGRERGTTVVPTTRSNPLEITSTPPLTETPTAVVASPEQPANVPEPDAEPPVELPRGCGVAPAVHGTLSRRANGRDYKVVVPESYDPMKQYALVVLLHEVAEFPENVLRYTGFETDAHQREYIVVAPTGSFLDPWNGEQHRYLETFEATMDEFCIDRDRVYAVGVGAGGKGVERFPCLFPVRAIANSGHRNTNDEARACIATSPTPFLYLSHRLDRYNPLEGGTGSTVCHAAAKDSLAEKEQKWRELNSCGDKRVTYHEENGSVCSTWACDVPFVSCVVNGGRRWPLAGKRLWDVQDCDGEPADFNYLNALWKFFGDQTPEGTGPKALVATTP